LFFLYTGKFNIFFEKYKAYMGEDRGKVVTEISGIDIINKKEIKLSDLKGKVVLLNFWATWCPPCRFEIPNFVDFYSKYHDKGFEIIGISVDDNNIEGVKSFIKKENINYPVVMYNYKNMKSLGEIVAVPTSILINKEGKIEDVYPGFYMKSTFERDIKKLLEN
jgi:peroxiredoxin